ncbi:universal stress protein [Halobacteriaceae archaeon SHR40]|uniref:universal stress protein n=1 Tax=Halovenus amylolytica TaxID=2500550 RepID=UPI000FE3A512
MTVHILVPMDRSPMAKRALEHAVSLHPDAEVTVLYVIDYIEESYSARALVGTDELRERADERATELFEAAAEIADGHGVEIETRTAVGDPSREIVAFADDHDIDQIVIGSHGRSPMSRILLGSVAETVTRRAPVPVTVVR